MTDPTRKQIAFVLYPGLTPLDLVGPLQALAALPRVDPDYEVLVVAESRDPVMSDSVVALGPSHTFDEVPEPFTIVVPGGGEPTLEECGHRPLFDYVSSTAATAEIVMTVCTGALVLPPPGCSAAGRRRPIGPMSTCSSTSAPGRCGRGGWRTAST